MYSNVGTLCRYVGSFSLVYTWGRMHAQKKEKNRSLLTWSAPKIFQPSSTFLFNNKNNTNTTITLLLPILLFLFFFSQKKKTYCVWVLISTSQEWPPLIDSGRELYDEPALANRLGDIVLECLKDIDPDADSLEAIQHGVTLCMYYRWHRHKLQCLRNSVLIVLITYY